MTDNAWYIVAVKSGADKDTEKSITDAGLYGVSISCEKIVIHRRTKKKLTKSYPLFSGYIFVRCRERDWDLVRNVSGVLGFLDGATPDETKYPLEISSRAVYQLIDKERRGELREAIAGPAVDLGDIVRCEVFDQMLDAVVGKVDDRGATLVAEINGMRVTIQKTAHELRAA